MGALALRKIEDPDLALLEQRLQRQVLQNGPRGKRRDFRIVSNIVVSDDAVRAEAKYVGNRVALEKQDISVGPPQRRALLGVKHELRRCREAAAEKPFLISRG